MKRVWIVGLLFLIKCAPEFVSNIPRGGYDDTYNWNCEEVDTWYYSQNLTNFTTEQKIQKIINYVYNNIDYMFDIDRWDIKEFWQLPEITHKLKTGDCEDFSILSMYLINRYLGLKGKITELRKRDSEQGHAILYLQIDSETGIYIDYYMIVHDFQKYKDEGWYIKDKISYGETIWICEQFADEVNWQKENN